MKMAPAWENRPTLPSKPSHRWSSPGSSWQPPAWVSELGGPAVWFMPSLYVSVNKTANGTPLCENYLLTVEPAAEQVVTTCYKRGILYPNAWGFQKRPRFRIVWILEYLHKYKMSYFSGGPKLNLKFIYDLYTFCTRGLKVISCNIANNFVHAANVAYGRYISWLTRVC